jgi:hypothetical protein
MLTPLGWKAAAGTTPTGSEQVDYMVVAWTAAWKIKEGVRGRKEIKEGRKDVKEGRKDVNRYRT